MESESATPHVSRRAFIAGALVTAGPIGITARELLAPGGAAAAEDPPASMFVGAVADTPSEDTAMCEALGRGERVQVRLAGGADHDGRPFSAFGVGDTVVAVDVRESTFQDDTLVARGVIPCVIGRRSDVVR